MPLLSDWHSTTISASRYLRCEEEVRDSNPQGNSELIQKHQKEKDKEKKKENQEVDSQLNCHMINTYHDIPLIKVTVTIPLKRKPKDRLYTFKLPTDYIFYLKIYLLCT